MTPDRLPDVDLLIAHPDLKVALILQTAAWWAGRSTLRLNDLGLLNLSATRARSTFGSAIIAREFLTESVLAGVGSYGTGQVKFGDLSVLYEPGSTGQLEGEGKEGGRWKAIGGVLGEDVKLLHTRKQWEEVVSVATQGKGPGRMAVLTGEFIMRGKEIVEKGGAILGEDKVVKARDYDGLTASGLGDNLRLVVAVSPDAAQATTPPAIDLQQQGDTWYFANEREREKRLEIFENGVACSIANILRLVLLDGEYKSQFGVSGAVGRLFGIVALGISPVNPA